MLHTQPHEKLNSETSTGSADNVSGSATQVRNAMVSTNDTLCSVTGAGRPRTGMAIVPVKVKRKGSDTAIITYAFLNSGSSSTFCTESVMKQLGIDGLKTRISLTTLEKKESLVDSSRSRPSHLRPGQEQLHSATSPLHQNRDTHHKGRYSDPGRR